MPVGESATEMPSLCCITLNTGFAFPIITLLAVAQQDLFPEDVRGKKISFPGRLRHPGFHAVSKGTSFLSSAGDMIHSKV